MKIIAPKLKKYDEIVYGEFVVSTFEMDVILIKPSIFLTDKLKEIMPKHHDDMNYLISLGGNVYSFNINEKFIVCEVQN